MKSKQRLGMSDRWVINASPLIVFGKIGQLDLLIRLAEEIVVPQAVADEIAAGPENDAARLAMEAEMFRLVDVQEPTSELAAWDLGSGETAVLSYALANPGWTALLDDGAARKCAVTFGIAVKGSLAIVVLAKKRGWIPQAKQLLHTMQEVGLRLDERTIRQVLKEMLNEDW
jgi:predicted nucleic acid-binding protein